MEVPLDVRVNLDEAESSIQEAIEMYLDAETAVSQLHDVGRLSPEVYSQLHAVLRHLEGARAIIQNERMLWELQGRGA